jgi:hypothetical protein
MRILEAMTRFSKDMGLLRLTEQFLLGHPGSHLIKKLFATCVTGQKTLDDNLHRSNTVINATKVNDERLIAFELVPLC